MTIFAIAPACAFMGVQSVGFVCAPHAGHPHIIAPAASRSSLGATLHYVTGHNASSQTRGGGRYLRRLRISQSAELFKRPAQLLCGKHRAGEACNGRAQCLWNVLVADRILPAIIVLKARGAGACHSGRLRVMPDSAVSQRCDVQANSCSNLPYTLLFGTAVLRHINQFCGSQIA